MAKKGQKFKKYNDEFRNKVVNDYFNILGGVKVLAKKYNILVIKNINKNKMYYEEKNIYIYNTSFVNWAYYDIFK